MTMRVTRASDAGAHARANAVATPAASGARNAFKYLFDMLAPLFELIAAPGTCHLAMREGFCRWNRFGRGGNAAREAIANQPVEFGLRVFAEQGALGDH